MPYNDAAIRKLIGAAFVTDEELHVFCSDHYPEVYENFTQGQTKTDRVLMLISYARRSPGGFDGLLKLIKEERPDRYAEFEPRLYQATEPEPVRADPEIAKAADALVLTKESLEKEPTHFQEPFKAALEQIDVISDYKVLHDRLHDLQYSCYPNIDLEVKRIFDDKSEDKDAGPNLSQHQRDFRDYVEEMQDAADRLRENIEQRGVERHDVEWREVAEEAEEVEQLEQARIALKRGIEIHHEGQVRSAMESITVVIGTQPERINRKLYAEINAANRVRLPNLIKLMKIESDKLIDRNPRLEERISRFKKGIAALELMHSDLASLINEHNVWQEADSTLRTLEDVLADDVQEQKISAGFIKPWQRLKAKTANLYSARTDEWAEDLQKADKDFEDVIAKSLDFKAALMAFRNYSNAARYRFFKVDKSLLELCRKLSKVREDVG